MSNQTTPAECHPEEFRYRGVLCKACYFRKWREDKRSTTGSATNATSSATVAQLRSPIAHTIAEVQIRQMIDKRLKELGIFPDLIPGDGSWARKLYEGTGAPPARSNIVISMGKTPENDSGQ